MISWVWFDVGETLIDERGLWQRWADWLGVPRDRFLAELAAVIARGGHHREVFAALRPGFDFPVERARRLAAGDTVGFVAGDIHADAIPCLEALRRLGLRIGIAGNTSAETERFLYDAGFPADVIASSASLGVEKPDPGFFTRLAAMTNCAPAQMAYAGDRIDNDVLAAKRAGLLGVFVGRGMWAAAHRAWPTAVQADITIDTLFELPEALRSWAS